jgi:hypothetical protein
MILLDAGRETFYIHAHTQSTCVSSKSESRPDITRPFYMQILSARLQLFWIKSRACVGAFMLPATISCWTHITYKHTHFPIFCLFLFYFLIINIILLVLFEEIIDTHILTSTYTRYNTLDIYATNARWSQSLSSSSTPRPEKKRTTIPHQPLRNYLYFSSAAHSHETA